MAEPKAAADLLLRDFRTLPHLLAGSQRRQLRACRDPKAVRAIASFNAAMTYVLSAHIERASFITDMSAFVDYLRASLAGLTAEQLHVLHFDTTTRLIDEQTVSHGTIDECPIYAREIIHRALDLGATTIVLVHNHPSGDTKPSRNDIDLTNSIARAAHKLSIRTHDHLIIGINGYTSFRDLGLL